MKKGMFKQVLSAMVLTMSLAGGAAFVSADSVQFSENGDYNAAVIRKRFRRLRCTPTSAVTAKTEVIRLLLTPTYRLP